MANGKPKVVIIGAGVSGMITLRHLKSIADVTVFEGRSSVGGLWSLVDELSPIDGRVEGNIFKQKYDCHFRNIYDGLVANLPFVFMTYADMPHEEDSPSFLTREQFRKYINRYALKFSLKDNVKLNTFVVGVKRANESDVEAKGKPLKVEAVSAQPERETSRITTFADYVIVANGHNSVPNMPQWKGAGTFPGTILHSRDYRGPSEALFNKKTVLIVGASYSGIDILIEIFGRPGRGDFGVKKVYLCGKVSMFENSSDLRPFLESGKLVMVDSAVENLNGALVKFKNGEEAAVDTIIACTGYRFAFPFLDGENFVKISHGGKFFGPLYMKTFCINEPRICFPGVTDNTCFGQMIMETQAKVIKRIVSGEVSLPSKEEMTSENDEDMQKYADEALKNFYRPFCATIEDNKLLEELSTYLSDADVDRDLISRLNSAGRKIFGMFVQGDFFRLRKVDFRHLVNTPSSSNL